MKRRSTRHPGDGETRLADLTARFLGEPSAAAVPTAAGHVIDTAELCAEAAALERTAETLRRLAPPTVACELPDRILAAVARERALERTRSRIRFPRPVRPLSRAAAVFLAVALGGVIAWMAAVERRQPMNDAGALPAALDDAFAWLRAAQESDGSWRPERWGGSAEYTVGLTASSLLALLSETNERARVHDKPTIERAARFLVASQAPAGRLGPACAGDLYNHAMATLALLEARTQAPDSVPPETIEQAIDFIVRRQLPSGGWGYAGGDDTGANTGISVWQLMALHRARSQGRLNDARSLLRGRFWLSSMTDGRGHFGYRKPADSVGQDATLTAMGAYCMALISDGLERQPTQPAEAAASDAPDFYHWFFAAAAWTAGAESDPRFPAALARNLLALREPEGELKGSWRPVGRWSQAGGRLYSTSMAILSLAQATGSPAPRGG